MKLREVADSFAVAMSREAWSLTIDSKSDPRVVFIEWQPALQFDFIRELSPKATVGLSRRSGSIAQSLVLSMENVAILYPEGIKQEKLSLNALNFKLDVYRGMFRADVEGISREAARTSVLLDDFLNSARKMFDELPIPNDGSFMGVDVWKWMVLPNIGLIQRKNSNLL